VWVVVGLGNPGRRYRATRHNVGFRVVDRLAARWDVAVEREAHRALVGAARFYRVDPARVIAVHDDVDLEPGRVRIRRGGRAGGNRGVESLMAALGDPGFLRVKVGVGRPPAGPVPPSWVLSVPPAEELAALAAAEERAVDAVELLVTDGPERAMNRINQKEAPHGGPPL